MHRDIFKCLIILAAIRALCSAATPAPDPWRRSRRQPDGVFQSRSLPEPHDVTSPPRHNRDGSGGQPDSTRLTGAAAPPSSEPDGGTHPGRRTRRGHKSRRRGSRGGVKWRKPGGGNSNELFIGHVNVQSLKPKLPDIRNDLQHTYDFDILTICETWLESRIPDRLLTVQGYRLFRLDRPAESPLAKGHGGVAILVRDNLSCEMLARPEWINQAWR